MDSCDNLYFSLSSSFVSSLRFLSLSSFHSFGRRTIGQCVIWLTKEREGKVLTVRPGGRER